MLIKNIDTKIVTTNFNNFSFKENAKYTNTKYKFKNQVGIHFWKFLFFD